MLGGFIHANIYIHTYDLLCQLHALVNDRVSHKYWVIPGESLRFNLSHAEARL